MDNIHFLDKLTKEIIINSIILGLLYVSALYRFLRAFLFTEPIVIAVLGYSLPVFVILFEMIFKGFSLEIKDIISSFLITFGCIILVHEEYKKGKKNSNNNKSKPVYDVNHHTEFHDHSQNNNKKY